MRLVDQIPTFNLSELIILAIGVGVGWGGVGWGVFFKKKGGCYVTVNALVTAYVPFCSGASHILSFEEQDERQWNLFVHHHL